MKCVKEKGAEWVFVDTVYIKNENAVNEDKDLGEEAKPTEEPEGTDTLRVAEHNSREIARRGAAQPC